MSEDVGQVVPSVEEVARLVAELVASEWPTTQDERSAWFERHGIATVGAELVRDEHGSESWHSGDPGSPWPEVGWHVFEGDFVGISWFLWHGLPEDVVPGLAEGLRARFVEIAGEPMDETRREGEDYRFTAYWRTGGRSIDMYLHGGPVVQGRFHEQPVVQLHVDHVERARRADETAARAQPVMRGRDWAGGRCRASPPYAVIGTPHIDTEPRSSAAGRLTGHSRECSAGHSPPLRWRALAPRRSSRRPTLGSRPGRGGAMSRDEILNPDHEHLAEERDRKRIEAQLRGSEADADPQVLGSISSGGSSSCHRLKRTPRTSPAPNRCRDRCSHPTAGTARSSARRI